MADKWIQKADKKMEAKGTKGKFGKATEKKIAAGKRAGGERKKEAVFAENMNKIAAKRKHEDGPKLTKHKGRMGRHKAIGSHTGYTMLDKKKR